MRVEGRHPVAACSTAASPAPKTVNPAAGQSGMLSDGLEVFG
jgi:hypothetical protein